MDEFGYKVKRGTEEDWTTYLEKYKEEYGEDYIPSEGKLLAVGFVNKDDGKVFYKIKVGNGTTEFDKLPFTDDIDDSGITIEELQEEIESKQDKLVAGENITIDEDTNTISAVGGGGGGTSYTAGDGIDITSDTISVKLVNGGLLTFNQDYISLFGSDVANDGSFQASMPYKNNIRQGLLSTYGDYNFQPKLTAGTNITIDANNVISASGGHKIIESQNDPPTTSSDYEVGDEWIKGGAEVFKCVAKNGTSLTWSNLSLNNYDDLATQIIGGNE